MLALLPPLPRNFPQVKAAVIDKSIEMNTD